MTTIYSDSALTTRSFGLTELRALLAEPFLVAGVSAFWLVTLPFVGISLIGVKIWDAISSHRTNPLILRRRPAKVDSALPHRGNAPKAAHV